MINQHATDAIEHNGHGIRRIRKVVAYGARRTELRHYSGQPLGPVAGTKTLAVQSKAMNN